MYVLNLCQCSYLLYMSLETFKRHWYYKPVRQKKKELPKNMFKELVLACRLRRRKAGAGVFFTTVYFCSS